MSRQKFTDLAGFQPKQLEAWYSLFDPKAKYILYGGAMFGGKSYALRWAALGFAMYCSQLLGRPVPVGLFSEDYPTLKDRQISKIALEFPANIGELRDSMTDGLAFHIRAEFGGGKVMLRNLDDTSKYMSTEFAGIFVEELTKNSYETFFRLRTRLRYPGIEYPKFLAATNPGGIGHLWCQRHWITRNSGDLEQDKFKYIPATLDDNKFTTDSYRMQLAALPERERKAYKDGDWNAFEGQFFSSFDQRKQLIDPHEIPAQWYLVGSLDPGWASPLSFGLQARDFEGTIYRIGTYYQAEQSPEQHAEAIVKWLKDNPYTKGRMPNIIVSGHDAWAKKDRYAIMANEKTLADVFQANGLFLSRAQTDRHNGWGALKSVFPEKYFIFKNFNTELVDQLLTTLGDEKDPNDIQGKGNDPKVVDHAIDDARYGNMAAYQPSRPKVETPEDVVARIWQQSAERQHRPQPAGDFDFEM